MTTTANAIFTDEDGNAWLVDLDESGSIYEMIRQLTEEEGEALAAGEHREYRIAGPEEGVGDGTSLQPVQPRLGQERMTGQQARVDLPDHRHAAKSIGKRQRDRAEAGVGR